MEYKQLKEMPRFHLHYCIKFFNDADKSQIIALLNPSVIDKEDICFECLYEENETFSINLEFVDALFCGFSCSDAILYMFSKGILKRIEKIISKYYKNIKNSTLSIECYDNCFAERYYMYTDIVDEAAKIVQKLKPNIYFVVGKDGISDISELRKVCMKVCGIDIDNFKDHDALIKEIKLELNKLMENKIENFKEIILLRYAIKFVKKLSSKKIMW